MAKKYNPFTPNQPVFTGMFAGRGNEIDRLDDLLFQTREGNPSHVLIQGERGIGKTSLLIVAKHLAQGGFNWEDEKYDFLAVQLGIRPNTTLVDLASRISEQIKRGLSQSDTALEFLKKSWKFLARIQSSVVSLAPEQQPRHSQEELLDKTIYSIVDTVKAITKDTAASDLGLRGKKDGLVILIDEVDQADSSLQLGVFLKNLTEILSQEDANKVLLVLAGLPRARDVLRESHESSLRLFEEFKLVPLTKEEVGNVIKGGLGELESRRITVSVSTGAIDKIHLYSEGYPHFVQQIGYSAYALDSDNVIDVADIERAMFSKNGALDLIGDRYYKDLYFGKIKQDSYRQILGIMALQFNEWVSKKKIGQVFIGKKSTLTNGIKALRDRNIILSKPGERGLYRLQWVGFAVWINRINQRKLKENGSGQ